jgi:Protein of unknown function (DUF3551)
MRHTPFRAESVNLICQSVIDHGALAAIALAALVLVSPESAYAYKSAYAHKSAYAYESAYAREYPWCLSRESYLYCFYKTQEQCQWTASGIGGCALNPRLLFPNKPRDSGVWPRSQDR